MSYQVLARKWRPNSFATLVGQSHIVRALTNALDQERLHHAYLFTGTRGVGKTTLGRILAKCLNCQSGVSSTPCNNCKSCEEIATGRFIDLIEVDAASRTKVEDTRELLENVPYAPTTGRYKVYLIDEVHMLSTHSFNALLKTLEEPPPHVKFILATTDPQKLPVTVVSRCLQFHLKCLSAEQIAERLKFILDEENINYEFEALQRLARAAQGSMRDALSLLDQAIAFSNQVITVDAVKSMLSTIEASYLYDILDALLNENAEQLITISMQLASHAADFVNVLEELLSLLHQIAIMQFVPGYLPEGWDKDKIVVFAKQFSPKDIQLLYQIGLMGRKDIALAPTPRSGLEMILLRMLAFQPMQPQSEPPQRANTQVADKVTPQIPVTEKASEWSAILAKLDLTGVTGAIAAHCSLKKLTEDEMILLLDPSQSALLNKKHEERLTQAIRAYFQRPMKVIIDKGSANMETPAQLQVREQALRKSVAADAIQQDPNVQTLIKTFNGKILSDSIEAKLDE